MELQGGYNVDITANSFLAVLEVLMGESPPEMPVLVPCVEASQTVWLVAKEQSQYWSNIDVKGAEPRESML